MLSRPSRQDVVEQVTANLRLFIVQMLVSNFEASEALGLNPTDLGCLCLLLLHGPSPAGRLAEVTGLTTGAVTGVIDRLEEAGFVQRVVDRKDRRKVIVTPDAAKAERDLLPHFMNRQPAATPAFYQGYTMAELQVIRDFLSRLSALGTP